jgi:2-(1,2-epoxy-1,2-dihydrophenyl)acetyl-CoA isomerase
MQVADGVATVTLRRSATRNAWDDALGDGLERTCSALAVRDEVRCVVLAGDGPVFCAGADLTAGFPQTATGHDDLRATLRHRFHRGFVAPCDLPQPVVAAVTGPAIGAGACLALASDIAVMARSAYLQFRFTRIGLMPDVGATALLAQAVGPRRALEIFMLAEPIGADECQQLGLVSRVVDDGAAAGEAHRIAGHLAGGPTRAFAATKEALRTWSMTALAGQLEVEAGLQQTLVATEDWAEGRRAFRERRDPGFAGR